MKPPQRNSPQNARRSLDSEHPAAFMRLPRRVIRPAVHGWVERPLNFISGLQPASPTALANGRFAAEALYESTLKRACDKNSPAVPAVNGRSSNPSGKADE